jgi:hypothetical protein
MFVDIRSIKKHIEGVKMKKRYVLLILLITIYTVNLVSAGSEYNQEYYKNILTEKYGMQNNADPKEPPYKQMKAVIRADKSNEGEYNSRHNSKWSAVQVHNALENAGYKAGVVIVRFESGKVRAINCIQTSDRGLVYTDSTRRADGKAIDYWVFQLENGEKFKESCLAGTCKQPKIRGKVKEIITIW